MCVETLGLTGLAQICDMYEYCHVRARQLAHTQFHHGGLVHLNSLLKKAPISTVYCIFKGFPPPHPPESTHNFMASF